MKENNRIIIFDTTLSDGIQAPGIIINQSKKLRMAGRLENLGVDVVEAGFPAASSLEYESVREISRTLKKVQVAALCQANEEDIRYAWKAIRDGIYPRLHTFFDTSDRYMSQQSLSQDKAVKKAMKGIKLARSYTKNVGFTAKYAFQSNADFLCRIFGEAIQAGASTITLADTPGYALPEEVARLIQYIRKHTPNIDQAVIGVRCYNDLGLATANSLSGITNGAGQVEVTVNGIGKRAGNTSIEEVVMALESRASIFCRTTGIDTTKLYSINCMMSMMSGIRVPKNRPILGANIFTVKQDEPEHGNVNYTPILPEMVGMSRKMFIEADSDKETLSSLIWEMGYELTEEEENNVFLNFRKLAEKKEKIHDEDLISLIDEELSHGDGKFLLDYVHVSCGNTTYPTATVQILVDGIPKRGCMEGLGPVDAIFKTIAMLAKNNAEFLMLKAASITKGADAQGTITVHLNEDGLVAVGKGINSDIIVASALAYINGLNRLEYLKKTSEKNRNNFFQNRFS